MIGPYRWSLSSNTSVGQLREFSGAIVRQDAHPEAAVQPGQWLLVPFPGRTGEVTNLHSRPFESLKKRRPLGVSHNLDRRTEPVGANARRSMSIGWVVVVSLIAGVVVALVLVGFVFAGGEEHLITGSVMIAFGLGWALLAILSVRLTDQPQRWAAVPAAYMMVVGVGLLIFAPGVDALNLLGWVWPPVLLALAVWMIFQARTHLHTRTGSWLLYPVLGVLALAAVGGGYATIRNALKSEGTQLPGRLVDVGGHRLYVNCTGSGSPTVVLQAGLGESSAYWERIVLGVAADTQVCAYDRAGRGQSESASGPQDGDEIAADVHALLEGAQADGPFVFVGHSSGGVYIRVFASKYPDEVAGMVLLDAQPVEAFTRLPNYPGFYRTYKPLYGLLQLLARLGLGDVALARSVRDEFIALPTALEQGAALTGLGDRPLVVVSAGSGTQPGWQPLQEEMATLSTNSVQRVLADATHTSLISDETHAAFSTQAILDVVESVRTGTPLANP